MEKNGDKSRYIIYHRGRQYIYGSFRLLEQFSSTGLFNELLVDFLHGDSTIYNDQQSHLKPASKYARLS